MRTRTKLSYFLLLWLLTSLAAAAPRPLSIGLTPVFLDDQAAFLADWQQYLASHLQRPVHFVQRASYREVTALLLDNRLDFAWICGYPYVRNQHYLKLTAVPVYQGRPLYESYLIVPATDTRTHALVDLRGQVFAYSDPDSNSGWLVPQWTLQQSGQTREHFFRKSFFTDGHRNVIEAVAAGLAQGGAVDGYVWDALSQLHPELTQKTRIVSRYGPFGFPPIVASTATTSADIIKLRAVLIGMANNPQGQRLLKRLNLDGFTSGSATLYEHIEQMSREVRH